MTVLCIDIGYLIAYLGKYPDKRRLLLEMGRIMPLNFPYNTRNSSDETNHCELCWNVGNITYLQFDVP